MTWPKYSVDFTVDMNTSYSGPGYVGPAPGGIRDVLRSVASSLRIDESDLVRSILLEYGNRQPVADVSAMQEQIRQYAAAFTRLKKMASPIAVVQRVTKDNVTILVTGKEIEVEPLAGTDGARIDVAPGDKVRVTADTMQILGIVEDDSPSGEVVVVTRVPKPGTAEIDRAGSSRAVAFDSKESIDEGDRVVLDSSGTVITANLGKPISECIITKATGVTWDDIGGLDEAKRQLRDAIEAPTLHAGRFGRYGKPPPRGILLYGAPGCGKTLLVKAAATAHAELHGKAHVGAFYYIKGPELLDMFVGNTERKIREIFANARRFKKEHGFAPIICLDEAESILGKRGGSGFGLERTIVPQFLAEMDGLEETGAIVILLTNMPRSLDPAVIRDGRVDRRIRAGRPTEADARAILLKHLRGKPLAGDAESFAREAAKAVFDPSRILLRLKKATDTSDGIAMTFGHIVSGALLAGIINRATSAALHRDIGHAFDGDSGLTQADIVQGVDEALKEMLDVDLTDEVMEFAEGWYNEIKQVDRVNVRKATSAGAN